MNTFTVTHENIMRNASVLFRERFPTTEVLQYVLKGKHFSASFCFYIVNGFIIAIDEFDGAILVI